MTKKIGDVVNNWKIIENLGIKESRYYSRERQKYRLKREQYWKVECINCGVKLTKSDSHISEVIRDKSNCRGCRNKPQGKAGLDSLFREYKINSNRRKIEFSLSLEEFQNLTSLPCFYCKEPPSTKQSSYQQSKNEWSDYISNGVDRKDNTKGYSLDNCVSCCYICNRAKLDMGFDDFISYTKRFTWLTEPKELPNIIKDNLVPLDLKPCDIRDAASELHKMLVNKHWFGTVGIGDNKLIIYTAKKKHPKEFTEFKGFSVEYHYFGKIAPLGPV